MPYKKGQKWVAQVRINEKRKEKDLSEQEGSHSMGKQGPIKSRGDMAREDKHGILV